MVGLSGRLIFDLLEAVCDEVARNGLKKIIFVPSHGGNRYFASFFIQTLLDRQKDYQVYLPAIFGDPAIGQLMKELMERPGLDHAGEMETSLILAIWPEWVKMGQINASSGRPLGRLGHLPGVETSVNWYANFPDHYAGDARPATAEKGERLLEAFAQWLARTIQAVKEDRATAELYAEFFGRVQH